MSFRKVAGLLLLAACSSATQRNGGQLTGAAAPQTATEQFLRANVSHTGVSQLLEIRRLADQGGRVSDIVRQVGACIEAVNPSVQVTDALFAEVTAEGPNTFDFAVD